MRLHLFDKNTVKNSNIVKYYYNFKNIFIWIYILIFFYLFCIFKLYF